MTGLEHLTKEKTPLKVILIGEGAKILIKKGVIYMLLDYNEITLENFNKQNIIFAEFGIKAYLKDFVNDEVDGDFVVVDFYKKDENGIFKLTEQQDIEIYTNKTVDNLIKNIKGYIRAEFEIVKKGVI